MDFRAALRFNFFLGLGYRILASGLGKIAHREPANISGLRIITIQGLLVITLVSIPASTRLRRPQTLLPSTVCDLKKPKGPRIQVMGASSTKNPKRVFGT